jgi:hypothetical protein
MDYTMSHIYRIPRIGPMTQRTSKLRTVTQLEHIMNLLRTILQSPSFPYLSESELSNHSIHYHGSYQPELRLRLRKPNILLQSSRSGRLGDGLRDHRVRFAECNSQ